MAAEPRVPAAAPGWAALVPYTILVSLAFPFLWDQSYLLIALRGVHWLAEWPELEGALK